MRKKDWQQSGWIRNTRCRWFYASVTLVGLSTGAVLIATPANADVSETTSGENEPRTTVVVRAKATSTATTDSGDTAPSSQSANSQDAESTADATATTVRMRRITTRPHPAFPLPPLNFAGTPSGIDVLRVLDTGVLPLINTGIAHREAGVGQIGAGIVTAPSDVFLKATRRLAQLRGAA